MVAAALSRFEIDGIYIIDDIVEIEIANDGAIAKSWANATTNALQHITRGMGNHSVQPPKPPTPKQRFNLPSIPLKQRRKMLKRKK